MPPSIFAFHVAIKLPKYPLLTPNPSNHNILSSPLARRRSPTQNPKKMALSKPLFSHLKSLKPYLHPFPAAAPFRLRFLSFATPEEAAAERRRRKRRLRIEPPLSSLRQQPPSPAPRRPPPGPKTATNPNAPKLPEPVSALAGNRLNLHNRILTLIRENDLDEASLLVRHSIYSNCRPTIFTCNAVLAALLRQSRYADLLSLHRFITQASVAPTVITHNLLLQAYCDCRKTDTALEHYRLILKDAPFNPSPTTYRILVKGLVDNAKLDQALELKDDMTAKGFCAPDPVVYNFLMSGFVKSDDPDRVLSLFEELKEKLGGGPILDGAVYGNLMKGYFKKGMEKEAMDIYNEVLGDGSNVRFGAVSYNSVLDALGRNGKLEEAIGLFDRMMNEHNPPRRIAVNLGTFNVMVDAYCLAGRFDAAIAVFKRMGEKKCSPDTLSYNNLIDQLGKNGLVAEAEELYREMGERGINPDEYTYVLLAEACFGVDRVDDATGYFNKMVELGLRPNTNAYNKVIGGLVNVGRLDEARSFYDQMKEKETKPNITSYEMLLKAFVEAERLDDGLKVVREILLDEGVTFSEEMKELVEGALRKEGREDDLGKLYEDVEREKAEALARAAEEKARAEALAKEEEERKKAEAAAKEAAAARASAAAIEAVLGRRKEVGKEESTPAAVGASDGGLLKGERNGSGSVEEKKAGDAETNSVNVPDAQVLKEEDDNSSSTEETKEGAGDAAQQVSAS
ncbi:pentatricopeptide repeat-containing protein At3g49240, mitochondrial [Elaeis guineensis]|uniref:pentatricopeptide repeat-containing protein At3g49240, mitochondrial n=1 Tax=Elaeis guineensis var. tenera TaxID=51953 RepID=UPI003C6D677C